MSTWAYLGHQDSASPLTDQLYFFLWSCIINFSYNYYISWMFNIYIIF